MHKKKTLKKQQRKKCKYERDSQTYRYKITLDVLICR